MDDIETLIAIRKLLENLKLKFCSFLLKKSRKLSLLLVIYDKLLLEQVEIQYCKTRFMNIYVSIFIAIYYKCFVGLQDFHIEWRKSEFNRKPAFLSVN